MMRVLSILYAVGVAAVATTQSSETIGSDSPAAKRNFDFFGVNESGPEFGNNAWPGKKGTQV